MKTVVITGANKGIGFAFVQHYKRAGWQVYALCRQPSAALLQEDVKVIADIDVTDSSLSEKLSNHFKSVQIDLLINNAGVLGNESLGSIDYRSILKQLTVNSLGPLRVTEALLSNMNRGAKIALITSRMGSITDNTSGGLYGYRMSKAALNIAGVSLAHDVAGRGIAVAILHPGYVQTDMVNHHGDISADVAAERLAQRIDELNMSNSGTFWHSNGEQLPW